MVVLPACLLAACQSSVVCAQEYLPVVEDRVDTGVEQAPLVVDEPAVDERGGWDLGILISAAYDNNIFLSARGELR